MQEKWMLRRKGADFMGLSKSLNIDPVLVRVMVNRGLSEEEEMRKYLYGDIESLNNPHLMKGIDEAASLILKKISENAKIRVIGDYDIDGVMATHILINGLARVGAQVDAMIPDRIEDGYGLNVHLIEKAYKDGVDVVVTCDNGISAKEQIAYAKELGMTVIVTDHHEVPFENVDGIRSQILPGADVVVDPKQEGETYPFPDICGAAVAYKLICVLYELKGISKEESDAFIEYAGFATIGDVMDLQGENRLLARIGLKMLNQTSNIGMLALLEQNGLSRGEIKGGHIGFRLGPCINASGRLESARISLELLNCKNKEDALSMALRVTNINEERKGATEVATAQALRQIEEENMNLDKVLVVYLPDCHESLAGIVAGRIREAHNKPSLVITNSSEGAKGSARSIEEYPMYDALNECKDLLTKFGGHKMAAGFSLSIADIPKLRERMNENCQLTEDDLMKKIYIDADMPIDYIQEKMVREISLLEPFGKANNSPIFALAGVSVVKIQRVGEKRFVKLSIKSEQGRLIDAIYFGDEQNLIDALKKRYRDHAYDIAQGKLTQPVQLNICYEPTLNTYRGKTSVQLRIQSFS